MNGQSHKQTRLQKQAVLQTKGMLGLGSRPGLPAQILLNSATLGCLTTHNSVSLKLDAHTRMKFAPTIHNISLCKSVQGKVGSGRQAQADLILLCISREFGNMLLHLRLQAAPQAGLSAAGRFKGLGFRIKRASQQTRPSDCFRQIASQASIRYA